MLQGGLEVIGKAGPLQEGFLVGGEAALGEDGVLVRPRLAGQLGGEALAELGVGQD